MLCVSVTHTMLCYVIFFIYKNINVWWLFSENPTFSIHVKTEVLFSCTTAKLDRLCFCMDNLSSPYIHFKSEAEQADLYLTLSEP